MVTVGLVGSLACLARFVPKASANFLVKVDSTSALANVSIFKPITNIVEHAETAVSPVRFAPREPVN